MPLCSVIAYISPSTAWSYILYILQLDKMVWLRNEVAALIAVFICYKVITWTLRVTLTLASQFRQKGEEGEGNKVPPCSCTWVASSPLCAKGTGGKEPWWAEPTFPTGCWHPHTPPHDDQLDGELTASKTKADTGLGRLLSQTLVCGRHQMMMNMPETQSLLQ